SRVGGADAGAAGERPSHPAEGAGAHAPAAGRAVEGGVGGPRGPADGSREPWWPDLRAVARRRIPPVRTRNHWSSSMPRIDASRLVGLLALVAMPLAAPVAAQTRDLPSLLEEVTAEVEANRKLTQVLVDKIFSFA